MAILQALSITAPTFGSGPIRSAFAVMHRMLRAAETRRQLAQLDSRMLADIGLGRAEAMAEADRAPWDLARRH